MTLPRVTEILMAVGLGPDLSEIPEAILDRARERGTVVHAAIEAHAYGYLDESEISPAAAPYFSAYRKFLVESGHEPTASEIELVHPQWGYVGHPDRIGWLLSQRVILDWKSGEAVALRPAARQLAAYRLAWNATHPAEPVEALGVVQLRGDGTYRFHEIAPAERGLREQEFLAALTVYRARQEDAA